MDLDAVLTIKFTRDMVRDLENNASHAVALLEDEKFKDFTFLVEDQEIKVHVFAAMLEPHTQESQEGKVEIEDFDHETVKAAVSLIYRRNLRDDLPVEILLNLFKFADKYDLVDKINIWGKIRENFGVSTIAKVSNFSKANSFDELYNDCVGFFAENFEINTKNMKDFDDLDPGFVIDAVKRRYRE
uniref:BTB domain-containing protein n=1 Tax=Panagrolaimus sp. JU765 TaxID=591449 RepID=A0AC34RPR6_9BILA